MTTKERLHQLVEELPEREMPDAEVLLAYLKTRDPLLLRMLLAPEDDEPISPDDNQAADDAWQEYLHGEGRPWHELRADLPGD